MTDRTQQPAEEPIPETGEPPIPTLEEDQSMAPRPEEEVADQLRSEPDPHGRPHDDE